MSAPDLLTEEERLELELAEQARLNSGDWDSVAPGKAANFGQSFGRLIGLLKPHAVAFIFVSILGSDRRLPRGDRPQDPRRGDQHHLRGLRLQHPGGAVPGGNLAGGRRGCPRERRPDRPREHDRRDGRLRRRRGRRLRPAPHGDRRRPRDLRRVVAAQLDAGLCDQRHHGPHHVAPARIGRGEDQPAAAVVLRQGAAR